jgi:hypothetical protein
MSGVFVQLGLASFSTVLYNDKAVFSKCYAASTNGIIKHFCYTATLVIK